MKSTTKAARRRSDDSSDGGDSAVAGSSRAASSSPNKRHRSRPASPANVAAAGSATATASTEPSSSSADGDGGKTARLLDRVRKAKALIRTDVSPDAWGRHRYAEKSLWHRIDDRVPRIQYDEVSEAEFQERFERANLPVVIEGAAKEWSASANWQPDAFLKRYKRQKFKVGEDDDGNIVYMRYKHFARYSETLARDEDSPLYIFDSTFHKRTSKSSKKKAAGGADQFPMRPILDDFAVPKYFTEDLFKLVPNHRRPPHRWIVIGPERSGTGIHLDPLGTSAWNTLIVGYKRWCLFPPHIDKALVAPAKGSVYYDQRDLRYGIQRIAHRVHDTEAACWFNEVYPNLAPYRDLLGMLEILQKPGTTVFVPGGWHHVVVNLSYTVAITQNFCSTANFECVYLEARRGRPKMTQRWRENVEAEAKRAGVDVDAIKNGGEVPDPAMPDPRLPTDHPAKWAYLVATMHCLDTTPQIPRSSSGSASSTSSDSAGADDDSGDDSD
ncbi:hypothetical protein H9P43_004318 [Blastocladiella emersonii ATCC 22665]|nr:hypothetical protein H9P43_004318 [Blastocladiella emersonii ATCC 22665]